MSKIRKKKNDTGFEIAVYSILIIAVIICLYPEIYILSLSISSPLAVKNMEVLLWPVGFSLKSYSLILKHDAVLPSFYMSVMYVVLYTAYSMTLTILGAYALSRKRLIGRKVFTYLIWFTMVFSGGLIPTFLVVRDLGLYNSIWAMIIPHAISQWNLIVMKSSFESIPSSIEESAIIDGANDITVCFRIVIPLSLAVISAISLFYAVYMWNGYFQALIYLSDRKLYPLQLILRQILIESSDQTLNREMIGSDLRNTYSPMGFRAAIVVFSMIPMMLAYPFIQRYFIKGIMIGSIKG